MIYRENVTQKSLIFKGLGKKGKIGKVFFILRKNGDFGVRETVKKAISYKLGKTFSFFPNVPKGVKR